MRRKIIPIADENDVAEDENAAVKEVTPPVQMAPQEEGSTGRVGVDNEESNATKEDYIVVEAGNIIVTFAWISLFASELWFSFYWILTQSVRWNPIYHQTFKERLLQRHGNELPMVDVFICTANPVAEPPSLVMSTVLSMMAYDYPKEKLSVYLSDDAGSELTFYALCEACKFAKHWIPFCNKFDVEPRSPIAFFDKSCHSSNLYVSEESSKLKGMYEKMINRIDFVVTKGNVPRELKKHQGFYKWTSNMTHDAIIQILVDGNDENSVDIEKNLLPRVIYMAREKRPQHHRNFKAGSMNALLRVSSKIGNGPIILNVDCDMYSNNSQSIKDALCFFLDEEKGHETGFVQYPQYFDNINKNDLYDNSLNVINKVRVNLLEGWGGTPYIGTVCFHRREALQGRKYNKDYIEDWKKGIDITSVENARVLEEKLKYLASCTFEHNTLWGKEIGLKYGCAIEDMLTGLAMLYNGWKSKHMNPKRPAFLGLGPPTLEQTLVQYKRWGEGNLQIILSKDIPLLFGHQKINFVPKVSSPWFIPFVLVFIAKHAYSLIESLYSDNTIKGWWNAQRMWVLRRITSFLFALIDNILKVFGESKLAFTITAKVSDEDASKLYEQEVMDFGSVSSMFVIISTIALINLVCLFGGVKRLMLNNEGNIDDAFFVQVVLCGLVVAINLPIYEGLFLRKDKGRMPYSVTFVSLGIAMLVCMPSMIGLSFA
ncbi:LOW QUALITY PROTEIN: cellulose synthase-like protein E6 [Dioscorea cayenensis subsp. rotundata]|uniref:LOW QUALITY PROTEIN: cellulose synthase-like protein E6 n=1 Tax=Dioscorea cayennensis subsp. rotundata TaxID=55577 RepID=A0AB40AVP5_DIOCR|nr:LOW QUALITY PROTEIN: cellulose synthase-like protein E6 [Dioscorea cayenensis subsp. rotundata]